MVSNCHAPLFAEEVRGVSLNVFFPKCLKAEAETFGINIEVKVD